MSIFDILEKVIYLTMTLKEANAVLFEVGNYFNRVDNWGLLPHYAEHIMTLLHIANDRVNDTLVNLSKVEGELSAKLEDERRAALSENDSKNDSESESKNDSSKIIKMDFAGATDPE